MSASLAFLPTSFRVSPHLSAHPANRHVTTCSAARPPNDPSEIRTESEKRRNSPLKPMRRRRRRTTSDESQLDWDKMDSVPIVRSDRATPESGEDYWVDGKFVLSDADSSQLSNKGRKGKAKKVPKEIDDGLKDKLKAEVVTPYEQNWILRIGVVVAILSVLVKLFGGLDTIPIIPVPDL